MQFKDQIEFVRQHIKKNRMRVFTTILATTMGCAFLIVLASIAFGLQGSMKEEILSDDRLTKIEVFGEKTPDFDRIKKIDGVSAAYTETFYQGNVPTIAAIGKYSGVPELNFTDFTEKEKAKIVLSKGAYPKKDDEVVIGYNVAENLLTKEQQQKIEKVQDDEEALKKLNVGYKENLIGETIELSWQQEEKQFSKVFKITGISEKPSRDWDKDNVIQLSNGVKNSLIDQLKTDATPNPEEFFYTIHSVYATDLETVKAVNEELQKLDYATYTVSQQLEEINSVFLALKAGLIFVGTIAILIASIGIFNTMTMAVTERTREIGVMKAIGASPKLIQRLFVMESAYIGILGTAIAIISSYIISISANFLIPKILYMATNEESLKSTTIKFSAIPLELVLIASFISIGVAIISGWRPARKATKIDIVQALKQE